MQVAVQFGLTNSMECNIIRIWIISSSSGRIKRLKYSTRENSVHEWVQDNMVSVKHMSGKVNPTDIFTKEMKDIFSGFGTLLCLVFLILTTPLYSQSMSITPGNSLHRAYFQLQHKLLSSPVPPHTFLRSSGLLSVIPKP
jgi:hypothetical protein